MATTAKDVFNIAMGLIDEVDSSTGSPDTADNREYLLRTPLILTALQGELYPYSDTCISPEEGKRPVCDPVSSMDDTLPLDDFLSRSVLPYGLAAQLLADENPTLASFLQQRYTELILRLSDKIPASFQPIEDVYGGFSHTHYGRW